VSASVVVVDGEHRAALAVVRSLTRAGCAVTVCAAATPSLAGASRGVVAEIRTPDALEDPEGQTATVARILREREADILLPVTEPSLLNLLSLREAFPGLIIPFPDLETFRAVCDKTRVFEMAREAGIAVPADRILRASADLGILASNLRFPLVVKPARSVGLEGIQRAKFAVRYAANLAELEDAVGAFPRSAFPLHLQERVQGPGVGVFLLVWDGELLASFAHRRIREKPPSGGVSVVRESIEVEPELLERSRRLLERFAWRGVAMVEYKRDAVTGEPFLMEINGRFWGSLQLAIDAGVDFPRLLVEAACGRAPSPVHSYRSGVRLRWLWGDVDHLLLRLRCSPAQLALPAGAPGRTRAILEFLGEFVRARHEVFRLRDLGPAWRETVAWFRASLGRGGEVS